MNEATVSDLGAKRRTIASKELGALPERWPVADDLKV
jgi:hypothetical protein